MVNPFEKCCFLAVDATLFTFFLNIFLRDWTHCFRKLCLDDRELHHICFRWQYSQFDIGTSGQPCIMQTTWSENLLGFFSFLKLKSLTSAILCSPLVVPSRITRSNLPFPIEYLRGEGLCLHRGHGVFIRDEMHKISKMRATGLTRNAWIRKLVGWWRCAWVL